ncbi:MAG: solute carrier family 23 protein, partial [Angelakisella sp.]
VAAGLIYVVVAGLIQVFGVKKVMRFFPPVVTGPIIISIGLILAPTAITNAQTNWLLAGVALLVIIVCNIWGKGMVKIIPILLGVAISYLVALLTHAVDFTPVLDAKLFEVPLYPTAFAKFDLSAVLTIMPIALAAMMEHIGDMAAISATVGKNFIAEPGLARTLLGDGLATSLAGMFGGPANTTYGENTGVLALTKVYDPKVIRIAAVVAVILSFVPKFDAIVNTIPVAIIGGISLILYGMISAIGVRNVVENQVDFTKSRNLIIAAVILVSALGFSATGGLTLVESATLNINLSGLAIAAILGITLNAILPGNDYEFGKDLEGDISANLQMYSGE